jgi:hypothetical protein
MRVDLEVFTSVVLVGPVVLGDGEQHEAEAAFALTVLGQPTG